MSTIETPNPFKIAVKYSDGNARPRRGRRPAKTPKGRQVDTEALEEVRALLATGRAGAIC